MDQQNYELDQTGAEETPKKKKGSTVKGIVIGVIGTLLISWTGINVACLANKFTDPDHETRKVQMTERAQCSTQDTWSARSMN